MLECQTFTTYMTTSRHMTDINHDDRYLQQYITFAQVYPPHQLSLIANKPNSSNEIMQFSLTLKPFHYSCLFITLRFSLSPEYLTELSNASFQLSCQQFNQALLPWSNFVNSIQRQTTPMISDTQDAPRMLMRIMKTNGYIPPDYLNSEGPLLMTYITTKPISW